ncbi:MAG: signal peptidase I [Rhodothermales bacterium]
MEPDATPPPAEAPPPRAAVWAWVRVIVLAFLGALTLRVFVLEAYRIPSESMEASLLVGDYVLVSKLHYGSRVPVTLGIPLTDWYHDGFELPVMRLPGFTDPKRGDVVVFNYPLASQPLDRKPHYIKRVIGLPGDTVQITGKVVHVNRTPYPLQPHMKQRWIAYPKQGQRFPLDSLRNSGAETIVRLPHNRRPRAFIGTPEVAARVESWPAIDSVGPFIAPPSSIRRTRLFPNDTTYTRDTYGPLYVPAKGDTLSLTSSTWGPLQDIITKYEGHTLHWSRSDSTFYVDDVPTQTYVVEQDYYFTMGDNRDASEDSRSWGFVPKDHIVGKAVFVYFSWDATTDRMRGDRFLLRVP